MFQKKANDGSEPAAKSSRPKKGTTTQLTLSQSLDVCFATCCINWAFIGCTKSLLQIKAQKKLEELKRLEELQQQQRKTIDVDGSTDDEGVRPDEDVGPPKKKKKRVPKNTEQDRDASGSPKDAPTEDAPTEELPPPKDAPIVKPKRNKKRSPKKDASLKNKSKPSPPKKGWSPKKPVEYNPDSVLLHFPERRVVQMKHGAPGCYLLYSNIDVYQFDESMLDSAVSYFFKA